jgi:hypothetical protein
VTRIQGGFKIHGNGKGAVTDAYRSDSAGICQAHLERSGSRFLRKCQERKRNSVSCQRSVVAAWDNTADRRQAQSRPVEARGGLTRLPNGTNLGEKIATVVAGEFFPKRRGGQISRMFFDTPAKVLSMHHDNRLQPWQLVQECFRLIRGLSMRAVKTR